MPVKWLLYWKPNQGSAVNSQILKETTKCIESLNGVKDGKWKATLQYYKSNLRDESNRAEFPNEVVGVLLPEEPSKYYFIIRPQRIVMEADLSFQLIIKRLESYTRKLSFDFQGFQYQLGDFRLRVGKVIRTHALIVRAIVMEVEYLPISSMEVARKVKEEFLEIWEEALSKRSLPGKFKNIDFNFGMFELGDNYTPKHTAVRYAFFVGNLMAAIQIGF